MGQDDSTAKQPSAAGYAVGYGKPPLHTRFRKGRSGNPLGRPRRNTDLALMNVGRWARLVKEHATVTARVGNGA
jgi:hypothetical protein